MKALNQSQLDGRDKLAYHLHMVAVTAVVLDGDLTATQTDHTLRFHLQSLARDAKAMGDIVKDLKAIK
jgi:hypothetical protein|tara:strand:- start:62 stop:265 length:204 start_codon:yes stop_codon:yes gene_type:complete